MILIQKSSWTEINHVHSVDSSEVREVEGWQEDGKGGWHELVRTGESWGWPEADERSEEEAEIEPKN